MHSPRDRRHRSDPQRRRRSGQLRSVSTEPGTLVYHRFSNPSENTFDPAIASLKATQLTSNGNVEIECLLLAVVLDRYAAGRAIDFLNIDCEGGDLAVPRSLDWTWHRPTVSMVEDFKEFDATTVPARSPGAIRTFLTERGALWFPNSSAVSCRWIDRPSAGNAKPALT